MPRCVIKNHGALPRLRDKMNMSVISLGIKGPGKWGSRMFDALMRIFQSVRPQRMVERPPPRQPNLRLSVAVLMVEAALQRRVFLPARTHHDPIPAYPPL